MSKSENQKETKDTNENPERGRAERAWDA
jgi:hypothetical protein